MTAAIARGGYRDIPLYTTDSAPVEINLADNTNQWGLPPAAARAMTDAVQDAPRYPALYSTSLKTQLAAFVDVDPEMIVTGCGSDDVIDSAIRAFAEPGDKIAYPDPTFPMAVTFGQLNGLTPVGVPFLENWDVDPEAFLATGARVIYLCSPNNPTGTVMARPTIEWIVSQAPGLVIVDEAYAEFAGTSVVDLVRRSDRVVVTRTLSKAFGLAGLRIGYGVAVPDLVREIEKSRGPYKVNVMAERAAEAVLREDLDWVTTHVTEAVANRERFVAKLKEVALESLPSAANFVLIPHARATAIAKRMREQGVGIRAHTDLRGIGDALRISIGPWEMMERCFNTLWNNL